jgi:hypothetical protein
MAQYFNDIPRYPSDINATGQGYHKLSCWIAEQDKGRQERRIFFGNKEG